VDNCKLQVQVFYECLGIPASDEGSKFTTPPPIIIDSIDKRKIAFFLHSKSSKAALEKQIHDMHGQITWPSDKDIKFKIECTLTKETKDCRRLAKTWKADTKKQIDSFVDNLDIEKHTPLQEAWNLVMEKLRQINIENADMVTVSVEKPPTCEIYVVGLHKPVEEVSDKVKVIIEEVTDELNTKKQQIQEEVKLKHFQLLILVFMHFPDKIKDRFDNMEVKINTKRLVITFNGISKDITSAKVFMFETVSSIVKAPIGKKSQIFIKFLKDPEVGALVGRKIKEKGYVGVWDIQDNSVMMYSISDEDAVAAADIFKESLTETKVDVEGLKKSMLNSRKWTAHAQSIEDEYQQKSIITKIVVDQEQITVLCTSKGEAGIIREKIQDFFQLNTENEITIDLPPAQLKFLQEHMKDEVEKLERTLKQKNVIVAVKSDGILVKGNQQGVKDAADEVDSLVQKIYQMKHSMDKPGLQELMQTSKGKQKLMQVGKQADVVISNESDEDQKSTGRGIHPRSTGSASEGTVYTTNWGQEVIVVQGDIIKLDVDVIVNAANKDLVHSGGLAKVLVKKGMNYYFKHLEYDN
jgi:vacuolar-type H+-ATPase subunit E/Vma4